MLCNLCQKIDFSYSPLYEEAHVGFVTWDTLDDHDAKYKSAEYYAYEHHPSIEALRAAAVSGCHFCVQVLQELFHLRGHESDEAHHKGPIEIRYYHKVNDDKEVLPPKEIVVVAKTPIRDVKLLFDFVQFSRQSEPLEYAACWWGRVAAGLSVLMLSYTHWHDFQCMREYVGSLCLKGPITNLLPP
jgi:hypothetical protein